MKISQVRVYPTNDIDILYWCYELKKNGIKPSSEAKKIIILATAGESIPAYFHIPANIDKNMLHAAGIETSKEDFGVKLNEQLINSIDNIRNQYLNKFSENISRAEVIKAYIRQTFIYESQKHINYIDNYLINSLIGGKKHTINTQIISETPKEAPRTEEVKEVRQFKPSTQETGSVLHVKTEKQTSGEQPKRKLNKRIGFTALDE